MYDLNYFANIFRNYDEIDDGSGEYAVLALIIMIEGQAHVLFEIRALNMRRQPGEVCFPGGRIEQGETPENCAVREAHEELGVDSDKIKIIGNVGHMYSLLNEKVKVFVGTLEEEAYHKLNPNPAEVDRIFLVPFEFFIDRGPQDSFNYGGNYIWGLTARGVNRLIKLCR